VPAGRAIAKEVGRHIGWRGAFWHRRFSAEPILDDEALERRLAYIFTHGVKEGLVDRAVKWPGLTCIPELCHAQRRLFPWYSRTAQYWARQRGEDHREARFETTEALTITPFPAWLELDVRERMERARRILEEAETRAIAERGDKPGLGRDAVMAQDPRAEPLSTKRSPQPLCHASTKAAFEAFRSMYRDFLAAYREASELLRKGRVDVAFPEHCYRPPLPRNWMPTAPPRLALA